MRVSFTSKHRGKTIYLTLRKLEYTVCVRDLLACRKSYRIGLYESLKEAPRLSSFKILKEENNTMKNYFTDPSKE